MTIRLIQPASVLALALAVLGLTGCTSAPDAGQTGGEDPDVQFAGDFASADLSQEAQAALSPDSDLLVPVRYVKEAYDTGVDIVFVDARPGLDYEFGHIPGAINVPYFEVEEHLSALPREQLIVSYCECPHAEAVQVADALVADGFPHVKVIDEGLFGWTELGGELVAGAPGSG